MNESNGMLLAFLLMAIPPVIIFLFIRARSPHMEYKRSLSFWLGWIPSNILSCWYLHYSCGIIDAFMVFIFCEVIQAIFIIAFANIFIGIWGKQAFR